MKENPPKKLNKNPEKVNVGEFSSLKSEKVIYGAAADAQKNKFMEGKNNFIDISKDKNERNISEEGAKKESMYIELNHEDLIDEVSQYSDSGKDWESFLSVQGLNPSMNKEQYVKILEDQKKVDNTWKNRELEKDSNNKKNLDSFKDKFSERKINKKDFNNLTERERKKYIESLGKGKVLNFSEVKENNGTKKEGEKSSENLKSDGPFTELPHDYFEKNEIIKVRKNIYDKTLEWLSGGIDENGTGVDSDGFVWSKGVKKGKYNPGDWGPKEWDSKNNQNEKPEESKKNSEKGREGNFSSQIAQRKNEIKELQKDFETSGGFFSKFFSKKEWQKKIDEKNKEISFLQIERSEKLLGELSDSSEYRKRFEKISDRQAIINRGLKNNNFEKIELNTFDKVKNTWAERKKRKAKESVLTGEDGKSIFQGIKESDFGKWYFGMGKAKRLFLGGGIAFGVGGAGYAIGRMSSGIAAMGGSALTTLYFEKRISLAENKLHKSLDISGSANLKNEIVDLKKRQLYYSVGIGALSAFAIKGVGGILDSVDEVNKISENIIIESTDTGSESFLVGAFDNNMANSEVLEKTETKKIFDPFDTYNGEDFSVENNVPDSYINEVSDTEKISSSFDNVKESIDTDSQLEPIVKDNYIVQKGDTLSEIAQRWGVSINDISGYKSGNPDLIYPDEKLYIKSSIEISDPVEVVTESVVGGEVLADKITGDFDETHIENNNGEQFYSEKHNWNNQSGTISEEVYQKPVDVNFKEYFDIFPGAGLDPNNIPVLYPENQITSFGTDLGGSFPESFAENLREGSNDFSKLDFNQFPKDVFGSVASFIDEPGYQKIILIDQDFNISSDTKIIEISHNKETGEKFIFEYNNIGSKIDGELLGRSFVEGDQAFLSMMEKTFAKSNL